MSASTSSSAARACTVFCEGPILHYVQISGLFNDSKTFVDMPLKASPETVTAAFSAIPDPTDNSALEAFLALYFEPAGSDLDLWEPTDLQASPAFLDAISDPDYRQWGDDLNQLWKLLGRQVNASVREHPERHTFVPRQYPMIVPGGRFRESYYWDSWWIIRGLLVCDMPTTAEYVLRNLLDDVVNFGFVPNGGRIYYLDRSQPPLLAEMAVSIADYYGWSSTEGMNLVTEVYPILQQEYAWWMEPSSGHVLNISSSGENAADLVQLNHYFSNATTPRPESYREDVETATGLQTTAELQADTNWTAVSPEQQALYRNIRTGAETGWDFSSRWLQQSQQLSSAGMQSVEEAFGLSSIVTSTIVPAELNAILYRYEGHLAAMAESLGEDSEDASYKAAAARRKSAINSLMWNASTSRWNDLNVSTISQTLGYDRYATNASVVIPLDSDGVSVSSYMPLWAGLFPATDDDWTSAVGVQEREAVLASLASSGLVQAGGVLTTTVTSGQQWDSPNAWPPLVLLLIEGLVALKVDAAVSLADNITTNWLKTCFIAYNDTGYMYEKYNAFEVGVGGGGGEYVPQKGFGWSNGVALSLLQSSSVSASTSGSDDDEISLAIKIVILCVIIITAGTLILLGYFKYIHEQRKCRAVDEVSDSMNINILQRDHNNVKTSLI